MAGLGSLIERNYYLHRRLHSLTGIVPVGLFLIAHLATNSSIVWGMVNSRPDGASAAERGAYTFQHEVNFIHNLPFLIFIEVFGLWLPLAYHSILGVYFATSGRPNNDRYTYQANWRYTLQRISGYVGLLFVFYHIATLRWGWTWLPFSSEFNPERAASTTAIALKGGAAEMGPAGVAVALFYLVGSTLLAFHLANGLWTAAITWGLTITRQAQRRWGYVCTGLGAVLVAMTWMAVVGFVVAEPNELRQFEDRLKAAPVTPIDAPAELR